MVVTCPACGAATRDREFCDRCNADLVPAPVLVPPAACPLTAEGPLHLTREQAAALTRPEASVTLRANDRAWRLHWIPRARQRQWQPLIEQRLRYRAGCLPPCRLIPDPQGLWVAAEAGGRRPEPWLEAERLGPREQLRRLDAFLVVLRDALASLHAAGLVWLTFNPQELEEVDGQLRLTNLDLCVYPVGRCPDRLEVTPSFAAPEVCRFQDAFVGPATDVFHLALFAYYWLARFLPAQGFLGEGLDAFDFNFPPLRTYARHLPPGIAAVLERGLAVHPAERFTSVAELYAAWRAAVDRAEARGQTTAPVRWEIGLHSRPGLAKQALGGPNEDCGLVLRFASPERALVAVADGISSCDVGNGALASQTACQVVETVVGSDCRAAEFPQRITTACLDGARAMLEWARQRGHQARLLAGEHLMGTTLTAAWLEGHAMVLAGIGDSRAYLIDDTGIDQLTADGDLGTALLAAGSPPEEVVQLGAMARALHDCVGGCYRTPAGKLAIDEDHCRPTITHWPLLPGDVIVLCTDGLVEEGVFLDPAELADLVRHNRDLPAAALAEKLAEAADARQRLPADAEPEGFGDNISCAVIKIRQ